MRWTLLLSPLLSITNFPSKQTKPAWKYTLIISTFQSWKQKERMNSRLVLRPCLRGAGQEQERREGRNTHCLISAKVPMIVKLLERSEIFFFWGGGQFERQNSTEPSLQGRRSAKVSHQAWEHEYPGCPASKQPGKIGSGWQVLRAPTLYILFNLTPPPLKTGLNKVHLLICDCPRSWGCRHSHRGVGGGKQPIHYIRLGQSIFRRGKSAFSTLRTAFLTWTKGRQKMTLILSYRKRNWAGHGAETYTLTPWRLTQDCRDSEATWYSEEPFSKKKKEINLT